MRLRFSHIILGMSLLLLHSCASEVSQEDLVISAVEIKLRQWEESQIQDCKENAMIKASDFVDSLLLSISLESKLDTIPKPGKPGRPPKPEFKQKPDSVVVSPIYKKD